MANDRIDGDALLEKINPTLPRIKTTAVLDGALYQEWRDADNKLTEMKTTDANGRLNPQANTGRDLKKQAKLVQALEQKMRDAAVEFEFESLSTPEYQKLILKHPAREDDQFDFMAGYNRETVNDALVRLCLVNMEFSDAGWERLQAKCPPGEWSHLRETVMKVNAERVTPGKSLLASQILGQPNDD